MLGLGLGVDLASKASVLAFGPELVGNGTFTTDTAGWTATGATLSVNAGRLQIQATGASGVFASADLTVPGLVIGQSYRFLGTMIPGTVSDNWIELSSAGTTARYIGNGANVDFTFVAATTGLAVTLYPASADGLTFNPGGVGSTTLYDNISLKRIL